MRRINKELAGLVLGSLVLGGCFADEATPMADDAGMDGDGESGMADGDDAGDDAPNPGTTDTPPDTGDEPPDTGDEPPDTGDEPPGEQEFEFDDSPPADYVQVDRVGMPAINSAVISDKDVYNAASPADDATGMFVPQIIENLAGLHAALDDDLTGAGLVPCELNACVDQAAPLVVPDTLKIDLSSDPGFPNGRMPSDPVMDVTLAVVLLDLGAAGQNALSLVGVNPTANDVEFSDQFPYFAAPHQ